MPRTPPDCLTSSAKRQTVHVRRPEASDGQDLIHAFNATSHAVPSGTLPTLFEEQAARTPDATALIFDDNRLTYADLDTRANRLARYLVRLGCGPEHVIALALPRSIEMVVALLAVVKAGAAYLPLDVSYPIQRLEFMLHNSGAECLISDTATMLGLDGLKNTAADSAAGRFRCPAAARRLRRQSTLRFRTDRAADAGQSSLCPSIRRARRVRRRGLGIPMPALSIVLPGCGDVLRLSPHDRVIQKTPWTFDVSVWEFFLPLLNGACLVVTRPEGHKDSSYLVSLIESQRITTIHFVPSMLAVFLDDVAPGRCPTLRHVVASGETLSAALQDRCLAALTATLWNLYGPTEASIDVHVLALSAG